MTASNPSPNEPRAIHVSEVRFLGEQDGKPERLLKGQLAESFKQRGEVERAYLAQVVSGDQAGVALCMRVRHGADQNLVQEVGSIFASLFATQTHLDILFLSEFQELALRNVCAPFYQVTASTC